MRENQGIIKIIDPFQIFNFKHNVDDIKIHKKIVHGNNHIKDEEALNKLQKWNNYTQSLLSSGKIPKSLLNKFQQ